MLSTVPGDAKGWVAPVGNRNEFPREVEHTEGWAALGQCVWHQPHPSPQAYVNRFKFQSITADDTLAFFLEYFPELKEKGVDTIPGQHSTVLAREESMGVRAAPVPSSLCTLVDVFYWRCCCCQPGSVGEGMDGTGIRPRLGHVQAQPDLFPFKLSPCSALGCCFMGCP